MRITIIAATGGIGRHLLEQCLDRGHDVTAVVRTPAKLTHPVRCVQADLTAPDPAALTGAVDGADGGGGQRGGWSPTLLWSAASRSARSLKSVARFSPGSPAMKRAGPRGKGAPPRADGLACQGAKPSQMAGLCTPGHGHCLARQTTTTARPAHGPEHCAGHTKRCAGTQFSCRRPFAVNPRSARDLPMARGRLLASGLPGWRNRQTQPT